MFGKGTWIFDADPFCWRGTLGIVAIPSSLLNSFVTESLSNHLQQATLSEYKYSISPLFICMSTGISCIPFLSFLEAPIPYKPRICYSKKHIVTILKGFSNFQNNTRYQNFLLRFLFYPRTSQNDRGILSKAQRNENLKSHLIGLFLTYCFMLDRPLNFTICSTVLISAHQNHHLKQNY